MFRIAVVLKEIPNKLLVVHAVHMLDEAEHLVAVAVLIIIPAHDLDEVVVQFSPSCSAQNDFSAGMSFTTVFHTISSRMLP